MKRIRGRLAIVSVLGVASTFVQCIGAEPQLLAGSGDGGKDVSSGKDAAPDHTTLHDGGGDAGKEASRESGSRSEAAAEGGQDSGRDAGTDGGHDAGIDATGICNATIVGAEEGGVPGALDPNFNNLPEGPSTASARALVQDTQGRLYVVGGKSNCASATSLTDYAVTRLNAAGAIDSTYGTNGTVCVDFVGGDDLLGGAALDASGNLVLVGMATLAPTVAGQSAGLYWYTARLGVARLTPAGVLDTTFGVGGTLRVSSEDGGLAPEVQWALGVAVDTGGDQGIFAVGTTQALPVPAQQPGNNTAKYVQSAGWVAKISSTGVVSGIWGHQGFEVDDSLTMLAGAVVSGSSVFVVGSDKGPGPDGGAGLNHRFIVRKYKAGGTGGLDTTFTGADSGVPGEVASAIGLNDYALTASIDAQGNLVVGGLASVGASELYGTGDSGTSHYNAGIYGPGYVAVARYRPSGLLDPTFNDGGKYVSPDLKGFPGYEANMLAIQCDGKILLGALVCPQANITSNVFSTSSQSLAVLRLTASGQPDPAYSPGSDAGVGISYVKLGYQSNVNSLLLDPEQRAVIVSGTGSAATGPILTRFLP